MAKLKTQKELEQESTKWFEEIVEEAKKREITKIQKGYFYNFHYKSYNYPDLLSHYDTKPLILLFDIQKRPRGGKYLLGINFHWLSKSARTKLLNRIYRKYKSQWDKGLPLPITYNDIKSFSPFKFAYVIIRKYIRNNIKRKVVRIPHNQMPYVINLRSEKFLGITPERSWQLSRQRLQKRGV